VAGFVGLALRGLDAVASMGTGGEGSCNVQSTLGVYKEGGTQGVSKDALFWRSKLRVDVSKTRREERVSTHNIIICRLRCWVG
jgi:hypothetical protein